MKTRLMATARLPAALHMHACADNGGGDGGGGGSPPPPPSPPAAPPAPPPAPGGDEPFYAKDNYDEPTRAYLAKNGFKSYGDVVKTAMNAEQFIGAKPEQLLKLPADRSPDKMGDVFAQLGKPNDLAGYDVKPNAEIGLDGPALDGFLKAAHGEAHLLPFQVNALLKWYEGNVKTGGELKAKADETALAEADKAIRAEFGEAYDDKLAGIAELMREHGGDELFEHVEKSKLGNNLPFAKFMAKMVELTAERGGLPGERGRDTNPGKLTPDQAQAKLREFEQVNDAALRSSAHADHKQVVKERDALIKLAFPNG